MPILQGAVKNDVLNALLASLLGVLWTKLARHYKGTLADDLAKSEISTATTLEI